MTNDPLIKEDGFETYEYACMQWHTKKYSFDSIVEIIHEGVVLHNRTYYSTEDLLQANIHKEMILRAAASMSKKQIKIGDRVKVKDQDIYGKVIYDHGTEVVIEDEDAETEDNQLCFKKSEIESEEDLEKALNFKIKKWGLE